MEASADRIIVVDDDIDIARFIEVNLKLQGYEVILAHDGESALQLINIHQPALAIVDWMMPKLDGLDLTRRLRADPMTAPLPIILLTARGQTADKVIGLTAGADDYLVKPFERQELLARLRALLRRRPPRGAASLTVGDLALNPDTHEVSRGDREIELTQREFELLEYLMRNERIVVPRQRLLEEVWGYDPFATTNTIEVFVSNLRRKLEAGGEARLLHTIRGAGYVLRA